MSWRTPKPDQCENAIYHGNWPTNCHRTKKDGEKFCAICLAAKARGKKKSEEAAARYHEKWALHDEQWNAQAGVMHWARELDRQLTEDPSSDAYFDCITGIREYIRRYDATKEVKNDPA